jgi:hypothetical protein
MKERKDLSPRQLVGVGGGGWGLMAGPSPDLDLLCFPYSFEARRNDIANLLQDNSMLGHASLLSSCDHALRPMECGHLLVNSTSFQFLNAFATWAYLPHSNT